MDTDNFYRFGRQSVRITVSCLGAYCSSEHLFRVDYTHFCVFSIFDLHITWLGGASSGSLRRTTRAARPPSSTWLTLSGGWSSQRWPERERERERMREIVRERVNICINMFVYRKFLKNERDAWEWESLFQAFEYCIYCLIMTSGILLVIQTALLNSTSGWRTPGMELKIFNIKVPLPLVIFKNKRHYSSHCQFLRWWCYTPVSCKE